MAIINVLGFLAIVLGIYLLFPQDPYQLVDKIKNTSFSLKPAIKKIPIAKEVRKMKKGKEKKGFLLLISDSRKMLILSNKKHFLSFLSLLSIAFMGIGAVVGVITNNFYLIPVLTISFGILPYIYVVIMAIRWQKELTEELETILSIITTSYHRKEDIVKAVAESIPYMNPAIRSIFEQFLIKADYITSNLKSCLKELQSQIHNEVWKEWIEALILCQDNKEMKVVLTPIVQKLSDGRILTEELAGMLYAPIKEYIVMVLLFFLNFPMLSVIMPTWYASLHTEAGKIVISICVGMILASIPGILALSKPVTPENMVTK